MSMGMDTREFLRDMIPAAIALVFMSLYMIVDGAFVSVLVGSDALAAINIVYPIADLMYAFGSMFAAGTAVQVAIRYGQGKEKEANMDAGMGMTASIIVGMLLMVGFLFFLRPVCSMLGATSRTMQYCIEYGIPTCVAIPCGMVKEMYLFLLRCDESPKWSMVLSIIGGVVNIILDYLFIAVFGWGIAGAGWATVIGMLAGCLVGILYFFRERGKMKLHFVMPTVSYIWGISIKGLSNFANNFAAAIITFLYNIVTLPIAGENGIAAVTIILYAQFLFLSVFTGYMAGAAPLFGFHYGAGEIERNQKLFRFCAGLVLITSVTIFAIAELFGGSLIQCMVTQQEVEILARKGMHMYAFNFLAAGVNIFAAGIFTAFGNGFYGGIISFSRALVVLGGALLILPHFLGMNGIWLASVVAEGITLFVSLILLLLPSNRKKYQYIMCKAGK